MAALDDTHDTALVSWVASANAPDSDFPIQNLPFGRYVSADASLRIAVAIGDQILDLQSAGFIDHQDMARLMAMQTKERRALRRALSQALRSDSPEQGRLAACLLAQDVTTMSLPCDIGDYTDFYIGIHHATAIGKLFRPDNPLLANYKWVPIGYHGRASSVRPSGVDFHRPWGQIKPADSDVPRLAPTTRLDFELELGLVVGRGNQLGTAVPIDQAEDHLFGMVLLNDWSARDLQAWEYQPLGPFLAKSFATTISPWIVTLEALAPFRRAFTRPADDPSPLPYLDSPVNRTQGAFDIDLQVSLQTAAMQTAGVAPQLLTQSNFAHAAYWTAGQLVAHHTVNGCGLNSGDLLGTGTLSGALPDQAGSMMELSAGGKQSITLTNGETRSFLQDGDSVTLQGRCRRAGARTIGFGVCTARVLPPLAAVGE